MTNPSQDASAGDATPGVEDVGYGHCLRCGTAVEAVGIESFRVGGTSGGWKIFFGELAELGEDMIDFEIFACPNCRKVELRVPVK
jgi:hypothetical protein